MIVRMMTPDEYFNSFGDNTSIYSSREFIQLNADKAEAVRCFVGLDDSCHVALGIVAGLSQGVWRAPFSAPYASIQYNKAPSAEDINDFFGELSYMLGGQQLRLRLHPQFVDENIWNRTTAVASRLAKSTVFDYNYHFALDKIDNYTKHLTPEAHRHYKRANAQNFDFVQCNDIERVYNIIANHHQAKGYNMAMTLDDVAKTVEVVPSDFFLLKLDGKDIAATYMQRVAPGIVQLINWGDNREYSSLRPMNMMAYRLCKHYADLGYKIFDFGPASTDGIPNVGLCRFKESIGCTLSLKPTFDF